ncbi:S-adenosyl-L-methionine-dependent methyltransferase [Kockovaella imperatae]|uniref:S-adenosyl-L-methionine-dependent methyltransferase n=1 Tax=Kockovaella imperatae TaxID=4999 RepID=A0A1Y1U8W1_9TREE|nr:S-adenosyl-L-methionine-dependent methyltransferase [Kockovaella imperatae]ORX34458.1 S-adenosyl-L-methionine-dependent methyltransferase [Kockovaella imperatae]
MSRKKNAKPGRSKPFRNRNGQGSWNDFPVSERTNKLFEEYYKGQGILSEEEWTPFLESLKNDLPTTFRITESRAHASVINDMIKTRFLPEMQNVELDGKKFDPPFQIPWFPGSMAWQVDAPKRVIRKSEPFKRFQRFLVGETEVGNLSRQEAVSMIPPLLMEVKPHHACLDMCAAPGSKTAQIIEALNPHHTNSPGLLIANDADHKRTFMLVHQTGRMPSKGLIVTNLDASIIPTMSLGNGETLRFDRILADVPCSGDGTLRKNLEIWGKWGCNDGNSLHSLQLRILLRAMSLMKPGGRLVYSTCSFNPVENEAVVAAALNTNKGQFSIVDASGLLPNLKRRPGLSSWKVATQTSGAEKQIVWQDSFEAYESYVKDLPESDREKTRSWSSTLWPPANAEELGLEHALRLVPHDQDTGGFFVCVIEKIGAAETEPANVELSVPPPLDDVVVADETGTSTSAKRAGSPSIEEGSSKRSKSEPEASGSKSQAQSKRQKRDIGFREEPFSYVDPDHAEIKSIANYFALKEEFPKDNFLVRNEYGDPVRVLYLTNDIVKRIVQNNDFSRMRLISAGMRGFVRQDSAQRAEFYCKWRIPSESILEAVPYLGDDKIIDTDVATLRMLIEEQYPPIVKFSEASQKWMNEIPLGNTIVRFMPGDEAEGHLSMPLIMPVWKANTSMALLIDKKEKSMLSLRTFGEDICTFAPLKDNKDEDAADEEAAEEGAADQAVEEAEGEEGEERAVNKS